MSLGSDFLVMSDELGVLMMLATWVDRPRQAQVIPVRARCSKKALRHKVLSTMTNDA